VFSGLARRRRQCWDWQCQASRERGKDKSLTRCLCHRLKAEVKRLVGEGGWSCEDVSSKCADQSFDVGDKLSGLCGELKEGSGSRLGEYEMMVGLWIEKAITLSISSTHRARERGF